MRDAAAARVRAIRRLVLAGFLVLAARAAYLTVGDAEHNLERGIAQMQTRVVLPPAPRGGIRRARR